MKIDKVFIINLEHRTDRREKIIKELRRVGIDNYEFFKAVKPTEEMIKKWNPQFINPIPEWFKKTNGDITKYRIGSLGCMLSHMNIIKICIKNKYENVLILEDDTIFKIGDNINFNQVMSLLQSQIHNLNFALLYLTGNHQFSTLEYEELKEFSKNNQQIKKKDIDNFINSLKVSENIIKIKGTLTTGSYIINKSVMKYIIENMVGYPREIDIFYSHDVQRKFPCYCIIPHITGQEDGYSDIVQKNVSYKF